MSCNKPRQEVLRPWGSMSGTGTPLRARYEFNTSSLYAFGLKRARCAQRKSLVHCSMVSAGLVTLCPIVLGDEKIS